VVQEQDSGNVATANLLTGLGIDQVFSRTDAAGERSLLTDALGSTIALADPSGTITTSYTYEPFGAATSTGASSTNRFQFTGRENDGASGLYFYRARYYGPTFGRFISEDPLRFPGGPDANLFAYVGNNPVSLIDPFGLDPGNGFALNPGSGCGFVCSVLHLHAADWASILGSVSVLASGVAIVAPLAEMPLLLVIVGVVSIGASAASTGLTCKTEGFSSSCAAGIVGTAVNVATFGVGSYAKAPVVRALAGTLGYLSSLVTLRYQEQYGGTPLLGMANYQI
jgi:RHS repeat-associated protein